MRRLVATLILTFVTAGFTADNKMLSLFLGAGWGFGVGGILTGTSTESYGGEVTAEDDHYLNYGNGIKLEAGAALRMVENLDIVANFTFSGGLPRINDEDNTTAEIGTSRVVVSSEEKLRFSQVGVKILLEPRFSMADLIDMYVGAGVGVFFTFSSREGSGRTNTTIGGATTVSGRYDTETAYGLTPALALLGLIGAEYPVSDFITIYSELGIDAMSVKINESDVRRTTYNGAGTPSTDVQHTEYQEDKVANPPPVKIPGTNFAIRVGVRIPIL